MNTIFELDRFIHEGIEIPLEDISNAHKAERVEGGPNIFVRTPEGVFLMPQDGEKVAKRISVQGDPMTFTFFFHDVEEVNKLRTFADVDGGSGLYFYIDDTGCVYDEKGALCSSENESLDSGQRYLRRLGDLYLLQESLELRSGSVILSGLVFENCRKFLPAPMVDFDGFRGASVHPIERRMEQRFGV